MAQMARPKLILDPNMADICIVEDEQSKRAYFPRYKHRPILSERNIRLLKLERQTQPWPLSSLSRMNEFSVIEHKLDDTDVARLDVSKSPYVTMSYACGELILDAPLVIIVDGERTIHPVPSSTWDAVHGTGPAIAVKGLSMWVDQICIDQHSTSEKQQQIGLMGEIYRRGWHCMIWLGDEDESTPAAFSLLRRLGDTFDHKKRFPLNERNMAVLSHARIRAQLALEKGNDLLSPPSDPGWEAVARLLQRPWFTRLWTFQEAVLSYKGDATVRCGLNNWVPLITFMRASILLGNELVFAGINFTKGRGTLSRISDFRYRVEHAQVTPLIWLLQNNSSRGCTDPRDRMYALLGTRKEDGPDYAVNISYEKSAEDLYIEITKKMIRSQASLRVCAEASERASGTKLSELPSWVPDWTTDALMNPFEYFNLSALYFKASNGRAYDGSLDDSKILTARGKHVASVVDIIAAEVPDAATEEERRRALVEDVLPLLVGTLQSLERSGDFSDIAHLIVNTIAVDGYTRQNNLGDFGLPSEAWSKPVCGYMMSLTLNSGNAIPNPAPHINADQWLHGLTQQALQCTNRRFAVLDKKQLALVPSQCETNDIVAILHGSSLPFILRKADKGCFTMVGTCYVDKIMHGEAVNWTSGDVFRIC